MTDVLKRKYGETFDQPFEFERFQQYRVGTNQNSDMFSGCFHNDKKSRKDFSDSSNQQSSFGVVGSKIRAQVSPQNSRKKRSFDESMQEDIEIRGNQGQSAILESFELSLGSKRDVFGSENRYRNSNSKFLQDTSPPPEKIIENQNQRFYTKAELDTLMRRQREIMQAEYDRNIELLKNEMQVQHNLEMQELKQLHNEFIQWNFNRFQPHADYFS